MSQVGNVNAVSGDTTWCPPEDRLLVATRAWLIWLQGLFRVRPLGQYRWSPNMTETEIVITDQNPDEVERTNKRPIISTARGPATFLSTSISQTQYLDIATDAKKVIDIISSSVTISVVAREGLEAQSLAYTIFRMIPVFKPSILRLGRMHHIGNNITVTPETQQGQILPGSSTPEWKMVQVIVPFTVQEVISSESKDFHAMVREVSLLLDDSGT